MKNKKYLFIPFLLAIVIAAFFAGSQVKSASAQTQCLDVAGAPIPCTPTVEIPCGQPGGPACPVTEVPPTEDRPKPTKTSLPVANPTEETVNAGASWSGSCSGGHSEIVSCMGKLANSCGASKGTYDIDINDDGSHTLTCTLPSVVDPNAPLPLVLAPTVTPLPDENYLGSCTNNDRNIFDCFEKFTCEDGLLVIKVDLYSGNGTKYDFYCIPDETVPQLDLPLSIPDPEGKVANWTGGCSGGAGLDACLDLLSAGCAEEGGDVSIWYDDDGAGVYCENQSESQPAPEATPLPLAAAEPTRIADGDWAGGCNFGDNYDFCMEDYKAACNNEGGVYNETHDDGGSNVSCSDTTAGRPDDGFPGGLLPWAGGGVVGILIGLLVPAIQKVRDAAARSKSARMPNNKNPELVKNQDDGGTEKATLYGRKAGDDKRQD